MAQATSVASLLRKAAPDTIFELRVVTTSGDMDTRQNVSDIGVGIFVKKIERALAMEEIDIAVHSLKDIPVPLEDGFKIAAVLERQDPRDALVSRRGEALKDLPIDAKIGTGSARRKALLLSKMPYLQIEPIRGNITTRLEKLKMSDDMDAVILATAGLVRLSMEDLISERLPVTDFIPACGQGALALEIRADDAEVESICKSVNEPNAQLISEAERRFLAMMGGGCSAPVSAYAETKDGEIRIWAFASDEEGKIVLRSSSSGRKEDRMKLIDTVAEDLISSGAASLIRPFKDRQI